MLLDRLSFKLVNIECMPTSTKFNAIVDLEVDIGDLLPYLATVIRGCTYIHGTGELNYMVKGHIITIRSGKITVTALADETEARQVCEELRNTINQVDEQRESIAPTLRKHARLDPLAVYRELPRTNCGECGEATCMAFAARVVSRELTANGCKILLEKGYTRQRDRLYLMLEEAEYEVQ
ncbi:MAG: (Fe-S)-binding protein [Deltaproteobacteria bacterium]|jgi:ArsR family metal-binding transcriptional regulator